MSYQESRAEYLSHVAMLEGKGVHLPGVESYVPEEWKTNWNLAMDAQPALTTAANNSLPMIFTTMVDPQVFRVLFTPNKAADIFGERQKGTWVDDTIMFPTVEHLGAVASYGDYNNSGDVNVNYNYPSRQSYLFQTQKQYGEREIERAGLARINLVSEMDIAAAMVLNKFANLCYFFGVQGLQNYGLLNDPGLSAPITPGTKANGGQKWITAGGAINASPNEVYLDFQALYSQLVKQTGGAIEKDSPMTLAMGPDAAVALTAANSFGTDVGALLKANYANITVKTAMQYEAISSTNSQGNPAGSLVQLIAGNIEGQETGYCAFNEKMRAHKIIPESSSWKQKITGGTWGSIVRQPAAIASMLGV